MKIRIVFDGKTYREFESDEVDDSLFSESKIEEIGKMFGAIDLSWKKKQTETQTTEKHKTNNPA